MRAIVFEQFGEPAEVLQLRDVPMPEPGPGQVRVRMRVVPINPSDLLSVRGQYGRLPELPATPGFEGVGVIDAVGSGLLAKLRGLRPGRRVAVLHAKGGSWQEQVVLPARQAVPVPDDLPDEQVAAFFVNPATALVMTTRVLRVPRGGWLLQTAANSALGRMVIRLSKHYGFHTFNVVRRPELIEELRRLGADVVMTPDDPGFPFQVRAATGGQGPAFALDPVGGPVGALAARSLAPGGRLLLYGTLSNEPIPLEPRWLMAGQSRIEGFWLSEWVKQQGVLTMLRLFREIITLMRAGVLTTPVEATYPLEQFREAVTRADRPGRDGKVLLRFAEA